MFLLYHQQRSARHSPKQPFNQVIEELKRTRHRSAKNTHQYQASDTINKHIDQINQPNNTNLNHQPHITQNGHNSPFCIRNSSSNPPLPRSREVRTSANSSPTTPLLPSNTTSPTDLHPPLPLRRSTPLRAKNRLPKTPQRRLEILPNQAGTRESDVFSGYGVGVGVAVGGEVVGYEGERVVEKKAREVVCFVMSRRERRGKGDGGNLICDALECI